MANNLEPFPLADDSEPAASVRITAPHRPLKGRRRRNLLPLWIAVTAIVCLGISGGVYWFAIRPASTAAPQHSEQTDQNNSAKNVTPTTPGTPQQYTSHGADLNLGFTYPSDWTVHPPSGGNANDQPITATSPSVSIMGIGGAAAIGRVVVSIRPASAQLSEFASNAAATTQNSVQIAYKHPTTAQHQYPYLTFVRLGAGDSISSDNNTAADHSSITSGNSNATTATPPSSFDEVIITGVTKFTKGQDILAESLSGLNPVITARFYACTTDSCDIADAKPLPITYATWQNADIFQKTQAIFESLQLR